MIDLLVGEAPNNLSLSKLGADMNPLAVAGSNAA
jgi:hypothetical protein